MFEDVSGSGHVYNIVDDEFTESCEQVSPLVESLDFVGFVLLVSLYRQKRRVNTKKKRNKWNVRGNISLSYTIYH